MAAIKAATSRAASLLGVEATVGTIAVGMQADLILVAGNPADDLASLADVRLVMKSGEVVHTR
jgi:imidazolonepropionase-like amidohydrolase